MQMAERRGVPSRDYMPLAETGVNIELLADSIKMGENFQLTLNIKNQTSQKCTLNATITGCVAYYTGVTSSIFMLESKTATVDPWKSESDITRFFLSLGHMHLISLSLISENHFTATKVMIDVKAPEYMPYLVEQSNLLFVVYGRIQETGIALTTMKVVALRPPELTIKVYILYYQS